MVDDGVTRPSSPDAARPPGWYSSPGNMNEQAYWDGERWTARRLWTGGHYTQLAPPSSDEEATGASPPPWSTSTSAPVTGSAGTSPERSPRRRWLVILAVCIVGASIAVVIVALSGSTGRSSRGAQATATSNSSPSSTSTSTSTSTPPVGIPAAAEVADCQSDAQNIETALQAFNAEKGTYPSPPSPWSAATYVSDFGPLTSAGGGGPFLGVAPPTSHYVIEYDASGHVWVAPTGIYQTTYNVGQSFGGNPDICIAAVG